MGRRPVAAGPAVVVALILGACVPGANAPTPAPSVEHPTIPVTETPSVAPSITEASSPTEVEPLPFDAREALDVTERLVAIGVRTAGSDEDFATQGLLQELLTERGWTVELQPFDLPQGGTSANVIASTDGRGRLDGPVVVVGAHFDTVPGTVGANDNASGTGVVVALATALAREAATLSVPVLLVGFGAEEYQQDTGIHHIGSEVLATELADRTVAMLSVDMVGNGPTTRVVMMRDHDPRLQQRLMAVAEAAGIPDIVADARGDISDHGAFARRSVPAAFLWTGSDGRLHTPADTIEHLDPTDLHRAGDLALAWLRGLTERDREGLLPDVG